MKFSKTIIINYILFAAILLLGMYVSNGAAIFWSDPYQPINVWGALGVTLGFVGVVAFFIYFNIKKNGYKPNYILICILGGLFLANMVTILVFREKGIYNFEGIQGGNYSFYYEIDLETKFLYIIQYFVLLVTFFVLVDLPYQIFKFDDFIKLVCFMILLVTAVFMVYSYVAESSKYIELLKHLTDGENWKYVVYSIFINKNNYAFMLTMALISLLYLHYFYKKWWLYLIAGFVYLNMIFTLSKALLGLSLVVIFAYLVYFYVVKEKENKLRNSLIAGGAGVVLIGGAITAILLLYFANKDNGGYSTIETRSWIWRRTIEILNNTNWISGAGHKNFGNLLFNYNTVDPFTNSTNHTSFAHNAMFESLGNGGLLLLIIVFAIHAMCIYLNIKNFKKNPDLAMISLILLGFTSLYALIESGSYIFPTPLDNAILTIFIVTPTLMVNKQSKTV